jgi:uncharacterized phosphosugar-binding protein
MEPLTLADFLAKKNMGGSFGELDHGILSPSGKTNASYKGLVLNNHSAKTDAMLEYFKLIDSGEVSDPSGQYTSPDFKARARQQAQYKIKEAERLERFAEQGYRPRVHRKKALELRTRAAQLLEEIGA